MPPERPDADGVASPEMVISPHSIVKALLFLASQARTREPRASLPPVLCVSLPPVLCVRKRS